eukprot:1925327-Prymnesium_polylepis.1
MQSTNEGFNLPARASEQQQRPRYPSPHYPSPASFRRNPNFSNHAAGALRKTRKARKHRSNVHGGGKWHRARLSTPTVHTMTSKTSDNG